MPPFGEKEKAKTESQGVGTVLIDKKVEEKLTADISKARVIIATDLGKKYNINIGVLNSYLKGQAERGAIIPLFKIRGIQVYTSPKGLQAFEQDKERAKEQARLALSKSAEELAAPAGETAGSAASAEKEASSKSKKKRPSPEPESEDTSESEEPEEETEDDESEEDEEEEN